GGQGAAATDARNVRPSGAARSSRTHQESQRLERGSAGALHRHHTHGVIPDREGAVLRQTQVPAASDGSLPRSGARISNKTQGPPFASAPQSTVAAGPAAGPYCIFNA